MEKNTISPAKYFEQVKARKQEMTEAGLQQLYENCLTLLEEYQRSGQVAAQKKLLFHLDNIAREKQLLDKGINVFVYKSDIDDYINHVESRAVKIIELENYQRSIPEEIIQKIEKCRGIFDKMYVIFTDYTGREERKIAAERRERDPILFGTFQDEATLTIVERFYFIGDWVDDYCDLTLDKMVSEVKRTRNKNILHTFNTPESIDALREQLNNLDASMNGLYCEREQKKATMPQKTSGTLLGRIKKAFRCLMGEL